MWLEMKVKNLVLDPLSNMPMIILRDEEEKRSLSIWVGMPEANAIALELEKITTARPMTHDLIKNILEAVDARVAKVAVTDLRENTFYAIIQLRLGNADLTVDSRPSDAIALALRVDAPIFVEESVLAKAESVEVKVPKESEGGGGGGKVDDPAQIKQWLESLKPGDFDQPERGKDPTRPDE
jgi:bifunctional DNase/RNase